MAKGENTQYQDATQEQDVFKVSGCRVSAFALKKLLDIFQILDIMQDIV